MNAVCVRCGRHGRYRLESGTRTRGRLCDCGGVIVKARIVDLFEFPPTYEPLNPTARAKLAKALKEKALMPRDVIHPDLVKVYREDTARLLLIQTATEGANNSDFWADADRIADVAIQQMKAVRAARSVPEQAFCPCGRNPIVKVEGGWKYCLECRTRAERQDAIDAATDSRQLATAFAPAEALVPSL